MGLDVTAVDLNCFGNPAFFGQDWENTRSDPAPAPSVPAIIDSGRGAVLGGAVRPAGVALEHVNNPGYHATIINTACSGLVLGKKQLDRRPGLIAQPVQSAHAYLWHPTPGGDLICY